jgi:beta-lactamase class A
MGDPDTGKKPIIIYKFFFIVSIIVLIIAIVFENILIIRLSAQNTALSEKLKIEQQNDFQLLSPTVAWLTLDDFLVQQKKLIISFANLKPILNSTITQNVNGLFGLYLEDLTTGAWLGINEKDTFVPASLLKLPVMTAVLKKIEKGELNLDDKIKLDSNDIDFQQGSLAYKGAGFEVSIKELLRLMIKESDNTAYFTFVRRLVSPNELIEAALAMGLPSLEETNRISPKEYANMLRGLYYSSYMRRTFSELALSLMLETDFNSQLPSGIPRNVPISHKIGMYYDGGYYHDCGIIYLPEKPYILCVMSLNSTLEEANNVISYASKEVYNYMAKKALDSN